MPPTPRTDTAGDGGASGAVSVGVYGNIAAGSGPGVFAASYGGGGGRTGKLGRGGDAGAVTVTIGSADEAAPNITSAASGTFGEAVIVSGSAVAAISYGGDAYRDNGGNAGNVSISVANGQDTVIKTGGDNSAGLLALSYGGRGNAEGYQGGTAGKAGVYVSGSGTITTTGGRSPGIVVQSLGGLGQSKEVNNSKESAAKGGAAGAAVVENTFAISTTGSQSHGIIAQSAGAGGGIYAYTGTGTLGWGDQNTGSYGGSTVEVTNSGAIRTTGPDANGIVAQSIGGGGGHLDIQSSTGSAVVGGSAGSVAGNAVTVTNSGSITTLGQSYTASSGATESGGGIGIMAQSIGGGGGSMAGGGGGSKLGGDGTGSTGGTVTVTNSGAISTAGADAHGILAQSIGGGGGQGRNSVGLFLAVGGTGGAGGDGGLAVTSIDRDLGQRRLCQRHHGAIDRRRRRCRRQGDRDRPFRDSRRRRPWWLGRRRRRRWQCLCLHDQRALHRTRCNQQLDHYQGHQRRRHRGTIDRRRRRLRWCRQEHLGWRGRRLPGVRRQWLGRRCRRVGKAQASGNITSYGYDSMGVVVQSVGGGGGQGGTASAKSFSVGVPVGPDGPTLSAAVSIAHGGSGGTASDGGDAYGVNFFSTPITVASAITTSANKVDASTGAVSLVTIEAGTTFSGITTFGDGSTGMLVQSVGGGGGAGGDATANSSAGVLGEQIDKLQGAGDADAEQIELDQRRRRRGLGWYGRWWWQRRNGLWAERRQDHDLRTVRRRHVGAVDRRRRRHRR